MYCIFHNLIKRIGFMVFMGAIVLFPKLAMSSESLVSPEFTPQSDKYYKITHKAYLDQGKSGFLDTTFETFFHKAGEIYLSRDQGDCVKWRFKVIRDEPEGNYYHIVNKWFEDKNEHANLTVKVGNNKSICLSSFTDGEAKWKIVHTKELGVYQIINKKYSNMGQDALLGAKSNDKWVIRTSEKTPAETNNWQFVLQEK